jgi:hypothetical protein
LPASLLTHALPECGQCHETSCHETSRYGLACCTDHDVSAPLLKRRTPPTAWLHTSQPGLSERPGICGCRDITPQYWICKPVLANLRTPNTARLLALSLTFRDASVGPPVALSTPSLHRVTCRVTMLATPPKNSACLRVLLSAGSSCGAVCCACCSRCCCPRRP